MHNNNSDSIGNGFEIRSFVVQLHYKHAMRKKETDCSGVSIIATSKPLVYHVITIYIYIMFLEVIQRHISLEIN